MSFGNVFSHLSALRPIVAMAAGLLVCQAGISKPLEEPLVFWAHDNSDLITHAFDLDKKGHVVGYYYTTAYKGIGFIRNADGTFLDLIYDVPGNAHTFAKAINEKGTIIGNATINGWNQGWSYDMASQAYSAIQVPGAKATFAQDITEKGVVAGFATFYDETGTKFWYSGFVLNNGEYTVVDVPGAKYTYVRAINEKGQLGGTYMDQSNLTHSFVMDTDGTVTTIDAKNDYGYLATIYSLSNKGDTVGTCSDTSFSTWGCFYDAATGQVTRFGVPGLSTANPWSSKYGAFVGWGYGAGKNQGFVIRKSQALGN